MPIVLASPVIELLEKCGGYCFHIRVVLDNEDDLTLTVRLTGCFGDDGRDGSAAARQIKRNLRSLADLAADNNSSTRLLHESVSLREP